MNLSIFSSDKYIVKSLLLFLIVFVAYSSMLKIVKPKVTMFQNQWVKNYSISEVYIYKPVLPHTVIVGSSMSARLLQEEFGNDVYNLSFAGGSALTGLNLVKKRNHIPELLLIETNTIERSTNNEMLRALFTPFIWRLKKHIISLQYTYQPINIMLSVIKRNFGGSEAEKADEKPNSKILKSSLVRRLEKNSKAIIFNEWQELTELKKLVDFFYSKGTHIVFFQIPVHPKILASKRYSARQKILHDMFAGMEVSWLLTPSGNSYETSDGVHLLFKSAREFSKVLYASIKNILENNFKGTIIEPR